MPDDSILVSTEALQSDEPYELVSSSYQFVEKLLEEHFTLDEISPDALRSYFVESYLADANSGGFPLFVNFHDWGTRQVSLLREGLDAIGAKRQLRLVERYHKIVKRLGAGEDEIIERLEAAGKDPEDNKDVVRLERFDEEWEEIFEKEDLITLNAGWLRSRPNLVAMSEDELTAELARRVEAQPDREARVARALANEPREYTLARALAQAAGQEFSEITAGDPVHEHNGVRTTAWHFHTDQGHHYFVEADGEAIMFDAGSDQPLAVVEIQEGDSA